MSSGRRPLAMSRCCTRDQAASRCTSYDAWSLSRNAARSLCNSMRSVSVMVGYSTWRTRYASRRNVYTVPPMVSAQTSSHESLSDSPEVRPAAKVWLVGAPAEVTATASRMSLLPA